MVVLGIEDSLLFLLRRAERRNDELLKQRHIESGAWRGFCGWAMGWFEDQHGEVAVSFQRESEHRSGSPGRSHRFEKCRAGGCLRGWSERKFLQVERRIQQRAYTIIRRQSGCRNP